MNSDQNNEECLVEQLRKELHSLKAEKERDEIKLILEKEEMEIAKKEEELEHFRARVQLRREKIQNMRQQIFINQMRKAEAEDQIEELKKTLEEVKVKEKADQKLLTDRLKAVQNKLLTASWVISRRKEKEELANLYKHIDEIRAKKEQLLQSIQEKEAIFAESRELPFKNFCVTVAAIALKNHALLKKLAQEYIIIAQLTQELSNQGILDTSLLSQYSQSQTSQIQPLEEKTEKSSPCLNNVGGADESEETGSFDGMREKNIDEVMNFQADDEIHFDNQKVVEEPIVTMSTLENNKLNGNVKLIIINEEIEKTASNIAMEIDKSHEARQISDELKMSAAGSEGTIDMNEKQDISIDVNIDSSQTSDKDNNIDNNFVANFIGNSEKVKTGLSGENEKNNIVDYNDVLSETFSDISLIYEFLVPCLIKTVILSISVLFECELVPGVDLKPMQSTSSDLDPTNFFGSFTNFAPNLSTINMSSNAYLGMDTEFDASAIFNLSSIIQNQSGSAGGASDYMALFGAIDTNASSHDNEGFELNFDNLPDGNEINKGIDKADRFFDF
ncbi:unnamed protein product [Onchocerca ochengi]|uniref:Nucleoporin GLE1 n=1 Tax=Onchocerca ochengi TaxID=42157 RepID=A0A182E3G5_ONCOC|nr:unnamed protein product [Onchocerca ochengi]